MTFRRQSANSIQSFKDQNVLQNILSSYREQRTRKNSVADCKPINRNVLGTLQSFSNIKSSTLSRTQNASQVKYDSSAVKSGKLSQKKQKNMSKQLFCNKILINKKLQKLQKQAITAFNSGNTQLAFKLIEKGNHILNEQHIQAKQHFVYLCYLKIHFCGKSQQLNICQAQFDKVKSLILQCSKTQKVKLNDYIFTIKSYQVQYLCSKIQYSESLQVINQLQEYRSFNTEKKQKTVKKINRLKIICLKGLRRFSQAIQAINQILQGEKSQQDKDFLILSKYECLKFQQNSQVANQFLLNYVNSAMNQQSESIRQSSYTFKIWQACYNQIKKMQDKLFLIYYLIQWRQIQAQKINIIKISSDLLKLYYQIGDYEQTLQQFQIYLNFEQQNPYLDFQIYKSAIQVKIFFGLKQDAFEILVKMLTIFKDQQKQIDIYLQMLEIQIEKDQELIQKQIQKLVKRVKNKKQGHNQQQLFAKYVQILLSKGKKQKVIKLKQKFNKL